MLFSRAALASVVCFSCVAVASSAHAADVWGKRFQLRPYYTGDQAVWVEARHDLLALRFDDVVDDAFLAHVQEVSTIALKRDGLTHVTSVRLMHKRGTVAVAIDPPLPTPMLADAAWVLREATGAKQVYPVAARASGRAFTDDHLVITAAPGTLDDVLALVTAKMKIEIDHRSNVADTALVRVGRDVDFDAVTASAALHGTPGLVSAEPDLLRELRLTRLANDPMFAQQWYLSHSDTNVPGAGEIFVPDAWDITQGDPSVLVAVFDSGVDRAHPDLVNKFAGGFDAVDGDDNPNAECGASQDGAGQGQNCPDNAPYRESHGTATSGIIAAETDNDLGVAGVCPGCSLYNVRLLGSSAQSGLTIAESFTRAVDDGVDVINNSWGPGLSQYLPISQSERNAFDHARNVGRGGRGTVILFSSGNETSDLFADPYASYESVIAVGASSNLDDWAVYSNYGFELDIVAPSLGGAFTDDSFGITTTDVKGSDGYDPTDYTTEFSGTSASCPVASGVVGLMLSVNNDMTADQVRMVLTTTADKIEANVDRWADVFQDTPREVLDSLFLYDDTGHSRAFGFGRVNAAAAVAASLTPLAQGGSCNPNDCGYCINDRCLLACEEQTDCPDGSTCHKGRCELPEQNSTDVGAPCSDDCEFCANTFDSEFQTASICTETCSDEAPCRGGFTCREIERDAQAICVPGDDTTGEPSDVFTCRNSSFPITAFDPITGFEFCSELCFSSQGDICPLGFHCAPATCDCSISDGIDCYGYRCNETDFAHSDLEACMPDTGHGEHCSDDRDCMTGSYCHEGECRADDREGCTVCKQCEESSDCGPRGVCLRDGDIRTCARGCSPNDECPGDSVCRLFTLRFGDFQLCASPEDVDPADRCVDGYTCDVTCRDDIPCPEGQVCSDSACVDAPPPPPPEEIDPLVLAGGGCNCSSTAEGAPLALAMLAMLAMTAGRRRRR